MTRAEVKKKSQSEVRSSLPPSMSSNSQSQTFCQVPSLSSLSLQVDKLFPDFTEFAVSACEVLGCHLLQASSPAEQAALDVWLRFSPTGETLACVRAMDPGQEFTSVDVISWCRLANPQAILT